MSSDSDISLKNEVISDYSVFENIEHPHTDNNTTETICVELPTAETIDKELNDPIITEEKSNWFQIFLKICLIFFT